MQKNKVLFLYTEMAEYLIVGIKLYVELYGAEVHIVRWPLNREAPFEFNSIPNVYYYEKQDFSAGNLLKLVKDIKPDLVLCSGWVDKDYLKTCRLISIPTVLIMDNHWENTIRQNIGLPFLRRILKSCFDRVWVPGQRHLLYAHRLGFDQDRSFTGFYTADLEKYNALYSEFKEIKTSNFPKRFVYVGRYDKRKGIYELWEAFIQTQETSNSGWELWCFGTGDEWNDRVQHPSIKHHGFVQPSELPAYLGACGVFVLPSYFDHWAVTIHEMAAAGFPILASSACLATEAFLQEGKNGFLFPPKDTNSLRRVLLKFMDLVDEQLLEMGQISHELAQQNSPKKWATQLNALVDV